MFHPLGYSDSAADPAAIQRLAARTGLLPDAPMAMPRQILERAPVDALPPLARVLGLLGMRAPRIGS